jgi:hypothetical protein
MMYKTKTGLELNELNFFFLYASVYSLSLDLHQSMRYVKDAVDHVYGTA